MKRFGIILSTVLVFLAIYLAGAVSVYVDVRPHVLSPCATEDSSNCLWDARLHGNGEGRSFIDWEGKTYYLDEGK